ncbi:Hypothetical protein ETEE_0151 [Edwardsiella anguillarum ET080813]|uniref:Uncharacterized protein n=1 Tax=Edwardsiella anguillarum ET080813 TaxID=667120 RepID=A0A076LEM4_9GAMM|nr:Hypothetical protein ETEE_0151 [Edwardsiella anguillarum ET080813]
MKRELRKASHLSPTAAALCDESAVKRLRHAIKVVDGVSFSMRKSLKVIDGAANPRR